MSLSHNRRLFVITTELVALVGASLLAIGVGPAPLALASTEQPVVAHVVPAPNGITIDSPWVTDSTGLTAWALGVDMAGIGVLARRDLATTTITTTTTVDDEYGATEGVLSPANGYIAFLAKRDGTGGRLVVIDPTTGLRVSSFDLAATDTAPHGLGFSPTGASLYFGSNPGGSQVVKVTTATGVSAGFANQVVAPTSSGIMYGTKFVTTVGLTPPRLVTFRDAPPVQAENTIALVGLTHGLMDPVLVGNICWYGTDTTPGRLIGVDFVTRKIVSNFALASNESGLRRITIPTGSAFAYATTVTDGVTKLVAIRLSDGARLGTTALGPYTRATSVSVSGRYVDVTFPGAVALVRTTVAGPPSAPSNLVATEHDSSIGVTWTESESEEPAVMYTATATSATHSATCTTVGAACTITGLTNGATYALTVRAASYGGTSAESDSASASPATLPSPVVAIGATRTNGTVSVTWEASANGGRAVTEYQVRLEPGDHHCITAETSCSFGEMPSTTEFVATVTAHSALGASSQAQVTVPAVVPPVLPPPVVPEPPLPRRVTVPASPERITLASVNRMSYTLTWTAPADGGSPIVDYRVATRPTGSARFSSVPDGKSARTSVVIRKPARGQRVYVVVSAVNAVGTSPSPTMVMLKGSTLYRIPRVVAVRFNDSAALARFEARSTRYDGTSAWSVPAHSSRL